MTRNLTASALLAMTLIALPTLTVTGQTTPYSLENAFPNLTFEQPVLLTHSGDGSNRIFVIEQPGRIRVFPNDESVAEAEVFLDITDRVRDNASEKGLLGLAFHPDFANNQTFYVNYTGGSISTPRTIVSAFQTTGAASNQGDPDSEIELLNFRQPRDNHNGGMIAFDADGYLYIATGDGGGSGDPDGNGQDRETLLGNILRIDVDNPDDGMNYGIPDSNPFKGNSDGFREEIFAWGFRNPWRFSIDHETGQIWVGDVGQGDWEEVDLVEAGNNYGWNIMEGNHCFPPSPPDCDQTGLTLPIVEYPHFTDENQFVGCSVTGGYVYRGSRVPDLLGAYLYADFCTGLIRLLRYQDGEIAADSLLLDTSLAISSFGTDELDELYIMNHAGGGIYRFVGTPNTDVSESDAFPRAFDLAQNYPNPFNPETTISYSLVRKSTVTLNVFDINGRLVRSLVNEAQGAGAYRIVWDGRSERGQTLSSGIYFYRLTAGGSTETRKMLFAK